MNNNENVRTPFYAHHLRRARNEATHVVETGTHYILYDAEEEPLAAISKEFMRYLANRVSEYRLDLIQRKLLRYYRLVWRP